VAFVCRSGHPGVKERSKRGQALERNAGQSETTGNAMARAEELRMTYSRPNSIQLLRFVTVK